MVSIYTYLRSGDLDMVSIYTYFNFWARIWCPFTHISILGPGYGVHVHIFQVWDLDMVSIYTYFNLGSDMVTHILLTESIKGHPGP